MENEKLYTVNQPKMIAFFFDAGEINDSFYGDVVFKNIIEGKEITYNQYKVVFSIGDVFDKNIYDDISPFVINDEICTIKKDKKCHKDYLFAVVLEDIESKIAINIDERLKKDFSPYLGMTSIDMESKDKRKQFWKELIRRFSIEGKTITCFGCEEEGFGYELTAKELGFLVNYDGFPDEFECDERNELFSTRKSSYIQNLKQLAVVEGRSDSDRGISEMNYALVKEVGIAGVQIWKAIEDINLVYIPKNKKTYVKVDYLFTSLYQASQGIERLLKVIIELIMYNVNNERQMADKLLMSHNHVAMFEFIAKRKEISLNKKCNQLLKILSKFYSQARYNRFSFSENNSLELEIFQSFGEDISQGDFNEQIKHLYGKSLGKIAHSFYNIINDLSHELNIYVYELESESVAWFSLNDYFDEDLYSTLKKIEMSKRELIWYLIKRGSEFEEAQIYDSILPLSFEEGDFNQYIYELVTNENSCSRLFDFVSESYDELVRKDKQKWKERMIIDKFFSAY